MAKGKAKQSLNSSVMTYVLHCMRMRRSANTTFRKTRRCKECKLSEECKKLERFIKQTAINAPKAVPSTHTANLMKGYSDG